ncbi:hypothetical protein [Shivajiella indica]|uniref:Uncharacterized protein n=1 Tax=Shivajiella indica TaxID=872115 RepID=A0ABW5BBZ8_9BACT
MTTRSGEPSKLPPPKSEIHHSVPYRRLIHSYSDANYRADSVTRLAKITKGFGRPPFTQGYPDCSRDHIPICFSSRDRHYRVVPANWNSTFQNLLKLQFLRSRIYQCGFLKSNP